MSSTVEEQSPRWLVVLATTTAVLMFALPLACRFPLLDPDEGLHASIAQEMLERGDWIAPSFLGQPFLDKPILYFWAQAVSLKLLGESETAVRLPGLLFGFLGALTTGLLARQWFGRTVGWVAGIFYATTILPTAMAQAASHDVSLIPWINLAVLLLWKALRVENCRRLRFWLFTLAIGVFLGLSILTKGLMGVAVVGFVGVGMCFFHSSLRSTKQRWLSFLVAMSAAVFIALLVAAPWYIAMEQRNPDFLRYYFFDRHLRAFATASQPHSNQPWWYYWPILLGGGLPWIGYLRVQGSGFRGQQNRDEGRLAQASTPGCQTRRLGEKETWNFLEPTFSTKHESDSPCLPVSASPQSVGLLWFWLLGWTLFLTAARSKLATYLWPAFPPLAILAAITWTNWLEDSLAEKSRRAFCRTFCSSSWLGPVVLPTALLVVQWACDVRLTATAWTAAGIAAVASLGPLWPWKAGNRPGVLTAAVLSIAAQFAVVMFFVVPTVAENYSARGLAKHYNQQGHLPERLLLAEERIGSLMFYLDPKLRAGLTESRIDVFSADYLPKLRTGDVVALPERRIKQVSEYLDFGGQPYEHAGRYRLYSVTKQFLEKNKETKR